MLELLPAAQAERLRRFFGESGYDEKSLGETLGLVELPSVRQRNVPRLLDRTSRPGPLTILLRWFWIGIAQPAAVVAPFVPAAIVDLLLESRLLSRQNDQLVPGAMLVPYDGFLVASHHTSRIDAADPELVLWPNPTTRLLLRFTIRRPARQALDLGAGTGMLALAAAAHSQNVLATDLNPKAVEFARFNACLNGITNVECLPGDGFAPVAGRKFDLIMSNPPFFITPGSQFLFCDNPMDLDGLCRELVKQAPAHLEPDGYFQMLCEWVQIAGQDWHERLGEWFQNNGCDAWVLKGSTVDPSKYAQERITEITNSTEHDRKFYDDFMGYYRQRGVEAIHKGLVVMRRRRGHNWVVMEDIADAPHEPFGDAIERRFAARDFLAAHPTDERLLEAKPRLSPHARLEQLFQSTADGWQPASLTLKLTRGFPTSVGVQMLVAEFLGACNGSRTLREVIDGLSARVNAPPERVRKECLDVIRHLIEYGFVSCGESKSLTPG
jgi:methylase of polypeptide subunit release factors